MAPSTRSRILRVSLPKREGLLVLKALRLDRADMVDQVRVDVDAGLALMARDDGGALLAGRRKRS